MTAGLILHDVKIVCLERFVGVDGFVLDRLELENFGAALIQEAERSLAIYLVDDQKRLGCQKTQHLTFSCIYATRPVQLLDSGDALEWDLSNGMPLNMV